MKTCSPFAMMFLAVVLCMLPCRQAVAGIDSLAVTPGKYFVAEDDEVEVSIAVDCPAMAALRIDITFDGIHMEYVDGSAVYNEARVTPPNPNTVFEYSGGTLQFAAQNYGVAVISAGIDWLYKFRVRGVAAGSMPLAPVVVGPLTEKYIVPDPITVSTDDRVTVYAVTGLPDNPTNRTEATVTVVGQDTYVTQYKYKLDNGNYSALSILPSTPIHLTGLAEGAHILSIIVGNAADPANWQPVSAAFEYIWEINPAVPDNPTLASSTPALSTPFNSGPVALIWTLESGATNHSYSWVLDRNPKTSALETVSGTSPPSSLTSGMFTAGDGDYYLHLRTNAATDGLGEWSATTHFGPWFLDTTPPAAALVVPPRDPDNNTINVILAVSAAGTSRDAVTAYKYRCNNGTLNGETPVGTFIVKDLIANRSNTLYLYGKDAAGNWQTAPTMYSWLIDKTRPVLGTLSTSPSASTYFNAASPVPYTVTIAAPRDPATDTLSAIAGYAWLVSQDPEDLALGYEVLDRYLPVSFNVPGAPEGSYYLLVRAFDAAGNDSSHTYGPWILDKTPPVITLCPADKTVSTDAGVCTLARANAGLTGLTATDNLTAPGALLIANNAPNPLPPGDTTVTWTVTDLAGNFQTCIQKVTVVDSEKPVITHCPVDKTISTDAGACALARANAGLTGLTATDNCTAAGALIITNNAPDPLPLGDTMVTWTVTDAANNFQTCVQKVTVMDSEKPAITLCPADKTVSTDAGACTLAIANAGLTGLTATDNCTAPGALVIMNNAPDPLPPGDTTVTWTVTDAANNFQTCTQKVTVVDSEKPAITLCPADKTVSADAGAITLARANAGLTGLTATDNCTAVGALVITNNAPDVLPLGDTTVTWTVTDAANNFQTCTQKVTVVWAVTLELQPGWNLVSFPGIPLAEDGAGLLTHTSGGVVWSWNGIAYESSRQIKGLQGYWLYYSGSVPGTVLVRGIQVTKEVIVLPGWNLIGAPINGLEDLPVAVLRPVWECVNGLFQEVSGAGSVTLRQGQGYWLYLNGSATDVLRW